MDNTLVVNRHDSKLSVVFKADGMYLSGVTGSYAPMELKIDLFPYEFHDSLLDMVNLEQSVSPRIRTGFGVNHKFDCRVSSDATKATMFELRYYGPEHQFFVITLHEQEILNLLEAMRSFMTQ